MIWTVTYVLMGLNALGGFLLLVLLRNGSRPYLAGIRWMLRLLACIPLVGVVLNLVQASGTVPLTLMSPLRICIGYTLLGAAVWGFVGWLVHRQKENNHAE